jgi:large subunit ribosomal protein L10e
MGIRPAKTVRDIKGQPWARVSQATPRKSFVKGAPRPKVRQYDMGADKYYEQEMELVAETPVQLRDNAMEAARQAANGYLDRTLVADYYLKLRKYPHLVLREHAALGVAGADRISKGMKKAFGRPKGRLAQFQLGDAFFTCRVPTAGVPAAREAFRRASRKLSGKWRLVFRDITNEPWNLEKKGREAKVFKKVEIEKPATPGAPVPGAPAAAPAAEAGKAEAPKSEEKAAEKKK